MDFCGYGPFARTRRKKVQAGVQTDFSTLRKPLNPFGLSTYNLLIRNQTVTGFECKPGSSSADLRPDQTGSTSPPDNMNSTRFRDVSPSILPKFSPSRTADSIKP